MANPFLGGNPGQMGGQGGQEWSQQHQPSHQHQNPYQNTYQPQIPGHPPGPAPLSGAAGHLNDAILRLDQRLLQMSGRNMPPSGMPQPAPYSQPQQPHFAPQPQFAPQSTAPAYAPQMAAPPPAPQVPAQPAAQPAPAWHPSPPTNPAPFDVAVAEIVARQNALNALAPERPASGVPGGDQPPFGLRPDVETHYQPAPTVDLSGLERQVEALTSQIEEMRKADGIEQTVASFRTDLTEIRRALTGAMPREAIQSLENEIRNLAQRIDHTREEGRDDSALAGIERALNDIYGAVRTLTPAEQLAGFDESIRSLGSKIDLIVRASEASASGPLIAGGIEQLETAIQALRDMASHVASNEALAQLGNHVRSLAERVDQISSEGYADTLSALEQRISQLTTMLESRERPQPANDSTNVEAAIHALSDRLDHMQTGNDGSSMLAHVDQRISMLMERIEQAQTRPDNADLLERSLSDIFAQLEQQRANLAAIANAPPQLAADTAAVEGLKSELNDLRHGQSQNDRRVQDSLEVLHNTLGLVVDRLAAIETDLKDTGPREFSPKNFSNRDFGNRDARFETARSGDERPAMPPAAQLQTTFSPPIAPEAAPMAPPAFPPVPPMPMVQRAPELPNPVHAQDAMRDARRAAPGHSQGHAPILRLDQIHLPTEPVVDPRPPIDASLPPDHPLEPGMRPQPAADRIAASEAAIGKTAPGIPSSTPGQTSRSDFIAAARRAAATASATTPASDKPVRVTMRGKLGKFVGKGAKDTAKPAGKPDKDSARDPAKPEGKIKTGQPDVVKPAPAAPAEPSRLGGKIRSLLVGASVVVIVLGTLKMAMNLLDTGDETAPAVSVEKSSAMTSATKSAMAPVTASETARLFAPAPSPATMSPLSNQPMIAPTTTEARPAQAPAAAPVTSASADVTGSVPAPAGDEANAYAGKLPDGIGGPKLRDAALKGDPAAAYEIGVRYAEGKGVAANYEEAAVWYERAANGGVAMAAFRLGTLYEKGLGLKKNLELARRHYITAAERGNAKAMHNLAVLDADGAGKGPDYKGAGEWFRKAATRGVADSQYNLGILYARGIGVEQNLAESFKWFSLAAAQGDVDAGRKRDDVAKRLDPQSQAAAKLAIQTFTAEPQPAEATSVAAPAGGWDGNAATNARAQAPARSATSSKAPKASSKATAAKSASASPAK